MGAATAEPGLCLSLSGAVSSASLRPPSQSVDALRVTVATTDAGFNSARQTGVVIDHANSEVTGSVGESTLEE